MEYLAHDGIDDGHPNVSSTTIDTTVPGPVEKEDKSSPMMWVSVGLIALAVLAVVALQLLKRRAATKKPVVKDAGPVTVKPTKKQSANSQ